MKRTPADRSTNERVEDNVDRHSFLVHASFIFSSARANDGQLLSSGCRTLSVINVDQQPNRKRRQLLIVNDRECIAAMNYSYELFIFLTSKLIIKRIDSRLVKRNSSKNRSSGNVPRARKRSAPCVFLFPFPPLPFRGATFSSCFYAPHC